MSLVYYFRFCQGARGNRTGSEPGGLRWLSSTALVLIITWAGGCSFPQNRAYQLAEARYTKTSVQGRQFEHVLYMNQMVFNDITELHIYIEGDGRPWVAGQYPARDPTPLNPLALQLMQDDPFPSIYIGRPCYFGLSSSAGCGPDYWTSRRYSPEVVESMAGVISTLREKYHVQSTVLIGYSGGGTLAMLLAAKLEGDLSIVTIAANLNTTLWSELRGFLPLEGSLNPIDFRVQTSQFSQVHFAGLKDEVVPIEVTRSYASTLDPDSFRYYPEFDHNCCWLEVWPAIIAERPWSNVIDN